MGRVFHYASTGESSTENRTLHQDGGWGSWWTHSSSCARLVHGLLVDNHDLNHMLCVCLGNEIKIWSCSPSSQVVGKWLVCGKGTSCVYVHWYMVHGGFKFL